ncbi:MAG: glycosyltransferase family 2 protein [Candidatus Omnitrophica bacterium]|nr:glycosyltransferase family 2 protein [Candidatus Omnitrophota bacterium]
MRTCVIIPTYNEENKIGELVKQIRQLGLETVVIDDGSADNTSRVAQDNGAVVLRNDRNQGKGASLIKGFSYASNNGADAVITMDGDGQHRPCDIVNFIDLAKFSKARVIVGNRMSKAKTMPLIRLWTNRLMSWFISLVVKQKIPDTQCGFRLIKKEVLEKLKLCTSKYETESEILIQASRLGFKIESVPIKTIYAGEKSQINPFVDTLRFIRFIISQIWTTRA